MKIRKIIKKINTILLIIAMCISTFPQVTAEVYAAEEKLPSIDQFATAEELNITDPNVVFGSIASPAIPRGPEPYYGPITLNLNDSMTLRYKADYLGSAAITHDHTSVHLSGVPLYWYTIIYLVVQNSEGAWAKRVNGAEEIKHLSWEDMGIKSQSFENYRVWLETTDLTDNKTYAVMATQNKGYTLTLIDNPTFCLKSMYGGSQSVDAGDKIFDIVLEAVSDYYLPDDYAEKLVLPPGLTATQKGNNRIIISGIPESDITVTMPDATEKENRTEIPNVTGGIGTTINGTDETMEVSISQSPTSAEWRTCYNGSTRIIPGTWYVRYKETKTQKASAVKEVTVTAPTYTISVDNNSLVFDTKNEGYTNDDLSETVTIDNTGNSDVTLQTPTCTDYHCELSTADIKAGQSATLTITPNENLKSGEYTEMIELTTTQGTSAAVNVSFKVNGALDVTLHADSDRMIEGQSVALTAEVQGGSGNYAYTWYADNVEDRSLQGNKVMVSPTVTTTYKVAVTDTIENKTATATITVIQRKNDIEVPENYTFRSRHVGYDEIIAKDINIQNTGNVEVTNFQATLTGTSADAFLLDTSEMQTTLAPEAETTVFVKPQHDLSEGVYEAEVKITGDNGIEKSIPITFTVEKHDYQWIIDSSSHQQECSCGKKSDPEIHIEDKGSVTLAPTLTSTGIRTYRCSVCGYVMRSEIIEKLSPTHKHEYGTAWKIDHNSHWHECECGKKSDAAVHIEDEGSVTLAPTLTSTGIRTYRCSVCGYVMRNEIIEKLSPSHKHEYGKAWKIDHNRHWHECDCGKKSDAAVHIEDKGSVTLAPTLTSTGIRTYRCSVCGYVMRSEIIEKLSPTHKHEYGKAWKSDHNRHWHECDCGKKTNLTAHQFIWKIDKEATASEKGKKHKECSVCGYIGAVVEIPASGISKFTYQITEGANQTYSGNGNLIIKTNGDHAKLVAIKIDGNVIDDVNYNVESGSTIITLKEKYLSALSTGTHLLTVVYNDGEVSTNMTIVNKKPAEKPTPAHKDNAKNIQPSDSSPQTGDETNMILWQKLIMSASVLLLYVLIRNRRNTQTR